MPKLHCMCGYIGFGKTTIAKQLEQELLAIRLTPDELMIELFGTDVQEDFMAKANALDKEIWHRIQKLLTEGKDVIYDAGPWSVTDRQYVMKKASELNVEVIWHQVVCDIETAKKRTFKRSQNAKDLSIDETFFNKNLKRYQPITESEHLTVIYHQNNT